MEKKLATTGVAAAVSGNLIGLMALCAIYAKAAVLAVSEMLSMIDGLPSGVDPKKSPREFINARTSTPAAIITYNTAYETIDMAIDVPR